VSEKIETLPELMARFNAQPNTFQLLSRPEWERISKTVTALTEFAKEATCRCYLYSKSSGQECGRCSLLARIDRDEL